MRPEILDRLVCAKYLFQLGVESLESRGPYAAGLAVLTFQDSTEMLLRAIGEHFHANIKDQAAFNQVLDEVEQAAKIQLSHRTALNQLNRARVNFKHLGLAPRDEDARKFRNDLEGFFPSILNSALGIKFDELSLASLVKHTRSSNWLRNAEKLLAKGDYDDSIEASAIAFSVFRSSHRTPNDFSSLEHVLRTSEPRGRSENPIARGVYDLARAIEERLDKSQQQLDLVSNGVNYDDFRRFTNLTPQVSLVGAGTFFISNFTAADSGTYENALFCSSFAMRTMLRLQDVYRERPRRHRLDTRKFRVTKSASIIVWPGDKRNEIIRDVEPETELFGYDARSDQPGFIAILQDRECAYISSECVEQIDQ